MTTDVIKTTDCEYTDTGLMLGGLPSTHVSLLSNGPRLLLGDPHGSEEAASTSLVPGLIRNRRVTSASSVRRTLRTSLAMLECRCFLFLARDERGSGDPRSCEWLLLVPGALSIHCLLNKHLVTTTECQM